MPNRGEPDALVFVFGATDWTAYTKSLALQVHLFGSELENMIVTLLPTAIHLLASDEICQAMETWVDESAEVRGTRANKAAFRPSIPCIRTLRSPSIRWSQQVTLTVARRDETTDEQEEMEVIVQLLKEATPAGRTKPKVGVLAKEKPKGLLAERWATVYATVEVEQVDVTAPLGLILAVKDEVSGKKPAVVCGPLPFKG